MEGGADHGLDHFLRTGLTDLVARWLEADSGLVNVPIEGESPLHLAVSAGRGGAMVDLLLDHGADVNARDSLDRMPLHAAIETDDREAIALLRVRGAEVDLFAAAGLGETDLSARLLAEHPDGARATQADGLTPLFYAAWSGDETTARRLLDAGADPAPQVRRLWACLTPLHVALQRGRRPVTRLLLERGADPNAFSEDGYWPTPLQSAARWGAAEDTCLLVQFGATTTPRNSCIIGEEGVSP